MPVLQVLCFIMLWTDQICNSNPQRKHLAMMKHCLRYILGRRCCAWLFDYQEWPGKLVILTDADWASDSERKRSVDCVHIYHGGWRVRSNKDNKEIAWIVVLGVTSDAGAGQ